MKLLVLLLLISNFSFATVQVVKGTIVVKDDAQFESMLEVKPFDKQEKLATLSETGYIIATTQFSFDNGKPSSNWVTMDEKVLAKEKVTPQDLRLSKGSAYGILYTSHDFSDRLKIGQTVTVRRYGIVKDHFIGKIIKLVSREGQDVVQVHFSVNEDELVPGSSCEIDINEIKINPYKISLLSLLHIGLEDYIVVKTGPGVYEPKHVTILDQDNETATVMLPSQGDIPYIARGAILMKPLLFQILDQNESDND